ncbi:MAG: hypothetical protein NT023_10435 [Armatimonadetes bacterium]|nr:hypothetical protein [Armatimonadota bacterium]
MRKAPAATERRLSTASQRIALFRHLAQMLIRLTKNLPCEALPAKERRRLHAAIRLLQQELQKLRLRL